MSAQKPPGQKKKPPTDQGSDDSLFDLIRPDDSLSSGTDQGSPAAFESAATLESPVSEDPLLAFSPVEPSQSSSDPLNELAGEFGESFANADPENLPTDDVPGLGQPLPESEAEDLGLSGGETNDVTQAFKTFLEPDSGKAPETELSPADHFASAPPEHGIPGESLDEPTERVAKLDLLPPEGEPARVIENVKMFSNQLNVGKIDVAAAYPFSLLIIGQLRPEEREKLLDVCARADLGIREPDLEPQLEAGRILIPRISEYAGIVIIQSLRTASVQFRLGPSDSIFATADTRTSEEEKLPSGSGNEKARSKPSVDATHEADAIPITAEASFPQFPRVRVVDVVTASAAVSTSAVEAERSSEYGELLEALQRELKYKAFRRGAVAIVAFKANLTSLTSPARYRLTVSGSAIRVVSSSSPASSENEIGHLENSF